MPRAWIQITSIIAITLLVYQLSPSAGFMPIDDGALTFKNPLVQEFNLETLKGAFTTYDPELYLPLTVISYQIDYLLGGGSSFPFHITNLLLHILNAVLVLLLVWQLPRHALDKKRWIPFLTAILFAIHPLHTEAVMWVAARKDLLSTAFYIGSLILYCKYRRDPKRTLALGSLALFFLGLLSKVTVVTLPLVLIIIDDLIPSKKRTEDHLLKWAYYIPAAVFLFIGMFGKTLSVYVLSYFETFLLAAKSSVFYLQKIFWPTDFLLFYQQVDPVTLLSPQFAFPITIIILMITLAIASRRYTKLIAFGLLWFGITLLPNLANFSRWNTSVVIFASDRYAYLPSIGIFFIVASAVVIFYNNSRFKHATAGCAIAIFVTMSCITYRQSLLWITPLPILSHTISEEPHTSLAHALIGIVLMTNDNYSDAISHLRTAVEITPKFSDARSHLGLALIKNGQREEGIIELQETINLEPSYMDAHVYLAYGQVVGGEDIKAEETLNFVLDTYPNTAKALHLLGTLEHKRGNLEKAKELYKQSLQANPNSIQVKSVLRRLLENQ